MTTVERGGTTTMGDPAFGSFPPLGGADGVAFRSAALADLERAIADTGHEPTPALVRELHRRLAGGS